MELIEIFENISSSDSYGPNFWQIIKSCDDLKVLALKPYSKIQPIVGHINRKLNTPSSRVNGLHLLKVLLPQCSDEVYSENAVSWMCQCLKGIDGHTKFKTGQVACETLQLLLESAVQLPELTKPVATLVVPKFFDILSNIPHQISWHVLKCLQTLLRNYGGPCGPHRSAVERFVLGFVDEKCSSLVEAASQCVALFPLMGGGGTGGLNHSSAWLSLQQQLIATMNQLLDELFQDITEIQTTQDASDQTLTLPTISEENPTMAVHSTMNRFVNVAEFLQRMYLMEFPVTKSVLPVSVFGLVCRGLAVTNKTLGRKISTEKLALASVLPQIHQALFRILRSLIACCGSSLLQYGSLICKLVLQTLKWTEVSHWGYGMEKPYCALRLEACNTLVSWLMCAKTGSCVELHADQLVLLLRADIVSTPPSVTLMAQHASGKHLSKQQRKKLKSMSGGDTDSDVVDPSTRRVRLVDKSANHSLCVAALQALHWIIQAGGLLVQPSVHKSLQETVIPILLDIQRSSGSYPIPYSVPACRQALYSLLAELTLDSHPGWPGPTQYALQLLATGQMDPIAEVSASCTSFLRDVRNLVHPTYPSLEFPKAISEMQESLSRTDRGSSISQQQLNKEGPVLLNGSVSGSDKIEPMGRKKRNLSPDDMEPQSNRQSKKKPKGAVWEDIINLREPSSKTISSSLETLLSDNDEIQELTVDSDEESDVREVYQINDDNILSKLKKNWPHITEITVEEDYIVEEVDDEESLRSNRDLYRQKRMVGRESSIDSAGGSAVQITEVEEIDLEETVKKRKKNDSMSESRLAEKQKVTSTGRNEQRSNVLPNPTVRSNVVLPNPAARCNVVFPNPAARSKVVFPNPAAQSNVVLPKSAAQNDDSICIGDESEDDSSSGEEVSDEDVRVEVATVIPLEDDDDDDDEEEEDSDVVQLSDSNDANRSELRGANTSSENVSSSTKHPKQTDFVAADSEEDESEIEEIDLSKDETVEEQPNGADEGGDDEDCVSEDDFVEKENVENKEREKKTDAANTEVPKKTPEEIVLEEERSMEVTENEVEEMAAPDTSTNDETPPIVNGSNETEVDEEDMLASFVDVVKPNVTSSDNVKSVEENVKS